MDAICINKNGTWDHKVKLLWGLINFWLSDKKGPQYLEHVTIIGTFYDNEGTKMYELDGYGDMCYEASCFQIIDSGELMEEEEEVDAQEYVGW